MTIRLACVYFRSEKRNYVIPVKDVIDLPQPKGVNDFVKGRVYQIRWPVLQREDSETVEKKFTGEIQLLAASPESMITQAAKAKPAVKLPAAFLALHKKPKPAKEVTRSKESTPLSAKETSKMLRKQVAAAKDKSSNERMREILAAHRTDFSKAGNVPRADTEKPVQSQKVQSTGTSFKSTPSIEGPSQPKEPIQDKDEDWDDESDGSGHKIKGSSKPPLDLLTGPIVHSKQKHGQTRKRELETSSDSEESSVSTTSVMKLKKEFEDKIQALQTDLAASRKKARLAETEATSLRLRVEKFQKAFEIFDESVKEGFSSPGKPNFDFYSSERQGEPELKDEVRRSLKFSSPLKNSASKKDKKFEGPSNIFISPMKNRTPNHNIVEVCKAGLLTKKSPIKFKSPLKKETPKKDKAKSPKKNTRRYNPEAALTVYRAKKLLEGLDKEEHIQESMKVAERVFAYKFTDARKRKEEISRKKEQEKDESCYD